MNCDDIDSLLDAYLDSELDARTTLEIERHVSGCARCGATLDRAKEFEQRLGLALERGCATEELWKAIERRLATADRPGLVPAVDGARLRPVERAIGTPWWRYWLWPSPWAYAALSAVWMLLAAVTLASREPSTSFAGRSARGGPGASTSTGMDVVFAQQQALRAELLDLPATPAASEETMPPQSRIRTGLTLTTG